MLLKLERWFDKFADLIGIITAIAMVLMIINVAYNVIARYFFNYGNIALQEMEWHLFSVVILLGISYTLKEDKHVRVDILYHSWKLKNKALINMIGVILFILPISFLILYSSIDYVFEAYISNEVSGNPGGLTHRWIVKSLIPLSFLLLIVSSIGYFIKNLNIYNKEKKVVNKIEQEGSF